MEGLVFAVPALALVIAAWDGVRRHYGQHNALTAEYTAKLEKRVAELEKGQREIALRLEGSPKISRFQRGG
jgi:hypothetical protein